MEDEMFKCPKCGDEVTQNEEYVSPNYEAACLTCDEDFYNFELITIKNY